MLGMQIAIEWLHRQSLDCNLQITIDPNNLTVPNWIPSLWFKSLISVIIMMKNVEEHISYRICQLSLTALYTTFTVFSKNLDTKLKLQNVFSCNATDSQFTSKFPPYKKILYFLTPLSISWFSALLFYICHCPNAGNKIWDMNIENSRIHMEMVHVVIGWTKWKSLSSSSSVLRWESLHIGSYLTNHIWYWNSLT